MTKNKIYFASDFHLGSPNLEESQKREKLIVSWLTEIEKDANAIYLVGDIFDFWFEYKKVIPKGFVRLLGKLAELTDNGVVIHLFVGNHDLWMNDYLEKEVGIIIHHKPIIVNEQNKQIFIAHGDGLGKGDYFYKFIRKIFSSRICQFFFSCLHPNLAFYLAHKWSQKSRKVNEAPFTSKDNEILYGYAKEKQEENPVDYYVFGHRHIPLELNVNNSKAVYINLGEWISHNSYAELKDGEISLKYYR